MTLRSAWPVCSRRRRLSMVRICSSRMTESLLRPTSWPVNAMCVGSRALPVWLVMAAAMTVGDQHRTAPALLAAHDRAQVGIENVASFHVRIHLLHTPRKKYVRISRRCFYSPTQRSKINKEPFAFFSVRMLPCHSMQEGAKNGGFSQTMYCRICEVSAPRWQMRGMRLLIWHKSS